MERLLDKIVEGSVCVVIWDGLRAKAHPLLLPLLLLLLLLLLLRRRRRRRGTEGSRRSA
jgi:hypothetical protein